MKASRLGIRRWRSWRRAALAARLRAESLLADMAPMIAARAQPAARTKTSDLDRWRLRFQHGAALLGLLSALLLAPIAHACEPGWGLYYKPPCVHDPMYFSCGCHRCDPGSYSADGKKCLRCGAGTIASSSASLFCTACAGDTIPNDNKDACVSCPFPLVPNAKHTACVGRALPNATAPGLLESSPAIRRQGQTSTGTPLRGGGPAGGARGPASVR